jgi:hypothetical protein
VKIGTAIREVHRAETELADELRKVGERHAVEHEVFHTCHVLAAQCEQHAARLHLVAGRYDADLPDDDPGGGPWRGVLEAVRQKASEPLGRTKASMPAPREKQAYLRMPRPSMSLRYRTVSLVLR